MNIAPILAVHIDSNMSETAADGVVVLVFLINVFLGWKIGLTRRIIAFGGTYIGALAAYQVGNQIADLISGHDDNTGAWSFIVVFLIVVIAVEGLAVLYGEKISHIVAVPFERVAGIVAGAVVGFFEVAIIFAVAIGVSGEPGATHGARGINAQAIHSATFSSAIAKSEAFVFTVYGPVMHNDLGQHFDSSATKVGSPNDPNGPPPANP